MRIIEALKNHFNKHMLTYGIISGVVTLIGSVFIPDVVRFLFDCFKSEMWAVLFGLIYAVILMVTGSPMILALAWLFGKEK